MTTLVNHAYSEPKNPRACLAALGAGRPDDVDRLPVAAGVGHHVGGSAVAAGGLAVPDGEQFVGGVDHEPARGHVGPGGGIGDAIHRTERPAPSLTDVTSMRLGHHRFFRTIMSGQVRRMARLTGPGGRSGRVQPQPLLQLGPLPGGEGDARCHRPAHGSSMSRPRQGKPLPAFQTPLTQGHRGRPAFAWRQATMVARFAVLHAMLA